MARFSQDVVDIALNVQARSTELSKPILPLRIAVSAIVAGLVALLVYVVTHVGSLVEGSDLSTRVEGIEATISSVVFLGAAGLFLFTLETRIKRRRALRAIHELRGLAHVIDMHQLAKDPKDTRFLLLDTASSPKQQLSHYELSRYLDYCSELLAIVNKMGALYARDFDDPVVLAGVDGLQRLVDGLSQKIWHKMALVDRIIASEQPHPIRR